MTSHIIKNIFSPLNNFGESLKREFNASRMKAINALVFITYRCTGHCRGCNIWKRESSTRQELPMSEWKPILKDLREHGIQKLEIFGGDALIRKDMLYDFIYECSSLGIFSYFPTGSPLLDKEAAKNLVRSGLDTIYFSLDDVENSQDDIRGTQGSFHAIKNAISYICEERTSNTPNIAICATISRLNYRHFEDVVEFASNYPIDVIYTRILEEFTQENIENSTIDGIKPEPYFTPGEKSNLLNNDDIKFFRQIISTIKTERGSENPKINTRAMEISGIEALSKGFSCRKCLVCSTMATMDPMGNVTPCPGYNKYTLGNLTKYKFNDIWGNEKHLRFIKHQREKKIQICKNCGLRKCHPSVSDLLRYYYKKTLYAS